MELQDVLPIEKWQELAKKIYEKFNMNGAVANKEGFLIHPPVGWANEICPLIKANPQSRVVCASIQQNMLKEVQEKKTSLVNECDIGFSKFVVPIFYKNEFLGVAGGCGFLLEGGELDTFYIAKLLEKDEKTIEKMVAQINPISKEKLQEAIEFTQNWLKEAIKE